MRHLLIVCSSALFACGVPATTSGLTAAPTSIAQLATLLQSPVNAQALKAYKETRFADYYTNLLNTTSDSEISFDGFTLSGVHSYVVSSKATYEELESTYGTIGQRDDLAHINANDVISAAQLKTVFATFQKTLASARGAGLALVELPRINTGRSTEDTGAAGAGAAAHASSLPAGSIWKTTNTDANGQTSTTYNFGFPSEASTPLVSARVNADGTLADGPFKGNNAFAFSSAAFDHNNYLVLTLDQKLNTVFALRGYTATPDSFESAFMNAVSAFHP